MRPAAERERKLPHPDDWGPRTFETIAAGDAYRLSLPQLGIVFDLDRLRRDKGDLKGHLIVRADLSGARTIDGILLSGGLYLSSIDARHRLAGALADRAMAFDIDWRGLLEELALRVEAADRAGTPAVWLSDVAPAAPDADTFEVYGLRFPQRHATILYGQPDSLKSFLLATALGDLTRRGARCLFLDWELDAEDHRHRFELLYGGDVPAVLYQRCNRPLVVEIDRLVRVVHDEGIDFVGIDSLGFACDGPPEGAEQALATMRAIRRLGVGCLAIAHQSKSEDGHKSPFGSQFWLASARAVYHARRSEGGLDESHVSVLVTPTKCNLSKRGGPVALEFTFDDDRVTLKRQHTADLADDLAVTLPLQHRIRAELRRGPRTYADLAEALSANVRSIERTIQRHTRTFTRLDGTDGVRRIALLDEASR